MQHLSLLCVSRPFLCLDAMRQELQVSPPCFVGDHHVGGRDLEQRDLERRLRFNRCDDVVLDLFLPRLKPCCVVRTLHRIIEVSSDAPKTMLAGVGSSLEVKDAPARYEVGDPIGSALQRQSSILVLPCETDLRSPSLEDASEPRVSEQLVTHLQDCAVLIRAENELLAELDDGFLVNLRPPIYAFRQRVVSRPFRVWLQNASVNRRAHPGLCC